MFRQLPKCQVTRVSFERMPRSRQTVGPISGPYTKPLVLTVIYISLIVVWPLVITASQTSESLMTTVSYQT